MKSSRRQFLIGGVQVTALLPALRFAAGARSASERVLVVIELNGGNDGLNTLVPFRQDAYWRARPALGLARASLCAVDDDHGLHPELGAVGELVVEGRAALVHSVGYPEPDRSHFRSMEIWHTGAPDRPAGETGWLGRLLPELALDPAAMPALFLGPDDVPLALRAPGAPPAPSCADEDGFRLHDATAPLAAARAELLELGHGAAQLAWLRTAARASYRAAERMATLAAGPDAAEYPDHGLARRLRLAARLVTGGFGTRVFYLRLGGFDTHAHQGPTHAALLRELGASLAAFQRDLAARGLETRVLTLVFSEFGRRVEENGSLGTDHGAAAPVFLVGGGARGLHGTAPDLATLEGGDLPYTTDLRAVYATLEQRWLGCRPTIDWETLDVF